MRAALLGAAMFGGLTGCNAAMEAPTGLRISKTEPGKTLSAPSSNGPLLVVANYLGRSAGELALTQNTAGADGITHVRFEQTLGGVRVHGAYAKAAMLPNGSLVHVVDALVANQPVPATTLTATAALNAALAKHGFATTSLAEAARDGNVVTFEANDEFYSAPTAERVAYVDAQGQLQSGYLVQTWSGPGNVLNHTLISNAGDVVSVELRTNNDSYRVFPVDPAKTPQTIVNGPVAGSSVESPNGWLGTGSQLTWNITGNNVNAYLDADKNNRPDRGGVAVSGGNFLAVADLAASPSTTGNKDVAVQNLFYLNNTVHDILYRHGFNEAAGNFQINNFGRGGSGNDPVMAEAQDGSGTDNANMSTPAEGQSPRMQMYLWSGHGSTHEVLAGGNTYGAMGAGFGAALTTAGLSGPIAIYNDGTGDTNDACEASTGSLSGKVAVVTRGSCNFTVKVLNAQNAGAIGVIVVNNDATAAFSMGGTDRKVKISSVMVTQADGASIKAAASATLRKKAVQPNMIDGDLDSDIVFHEYGHGLTWRMIGGMSGTLAGAIGEGASDTVAFLINGDDVVGEYAYGEGIRRFRYAGYPYTYKDVGNQGFEVHNDGEIYAAAMWRTRELLLAAGASNDTVFNIFVDGMNYTNATPAFENMRDGMLATATVQNNAAFRCAIWQGFAQFGIGVGAKGVATSGGATITETFAVPTDCQP